MPTAAEAGDGSAYDAYLSVSLMNLNLPHKKQGVSKQTAGAKTGLHSLLLVVKRTRSAVAKHADYCNPGLSEKKTRTSEHRRLAMAHA
jgi:hypothetical protein